MLINLLPQTILWLLLSANLYKMGRRNETNRLAHKKKVDAKKKSENEAKNALKAKRKAIMNQFKNKPTDTNE